MTKPVNPNISIPQYFAQNGLKTDFTEEKLDSGFSNVDPDVLAGDNLNKFIDDTYKGLNYSMAGVDDLYGLVNWDKINQSKALTTGAVSEDADIYSDILNYAHSTFDLSKFTVVGSPTISNEGIASGISNNNYISPYYLNSLPDELKITVKVTTSDLPNTNNGQYVFMVKDSIDSNFLAYIRIDKNTEKFYCGFRTSDSSYNNTSFAITPNTEYLCEFARKRNLEYYKDNYNNVLIKKKTSDANPLILQAHTDMVCVSNKDFDFTKEPIEVIEKAGYLQANGTTLGADNGIGVAFILNILDNNIPCNIEAVFTSS